MILYLILGLTVINTLGIIYMVVKFNKYDKLFEISDSNFSKIIRLFKMYKEKEKNRNKINLN